jgi:hypothetical protein
MSVSFAKGLQRGVVDYIGGAVPRHSFKKEDTGGGEIDLGSVLITASPPTYE